MYTPPHSLIHTYMPTSVHACIHACVRTYVRTLPYTAGRQAGRRPEISKLCKPLHFGVGFRVQFPGKMLGNTACPQSNFRKHL